MVKCISDPMFTWITQIGYSLLWLLVINSNSNSISSSYGYLVHPWPPKLEEIMQNEIELSSYVGHEKSQNELSSLLFFLVSAQLFKTKFNRKLFMNKN